MAINYLINHIINVKISIMKLINVNYKTIAISDLRRKFGEIEKELPFIDRFIVTKKGKPFAVLSADPSVKRHLIKEMAGSLKNTELDSDKLWEEALAKKSRSKSIKL